jgi:hypothetical protein
MSEAAWKRFRATTVMFPTWSREWLLYLSKQVAMEIAFVAKHLGTTAPQA